MKQYIINSLESFDQFDQAANWIRLKWKLNKKVRIASVCLTMNGDMKEQFVVKSHPHQMIRIPELKMFLISQMILDIFPFYVAFPSISDKTCTGLDHEWHVGCLTRNRNCVPFTINLCSLPVFLWVCVANLFSFCGVLFYVLFVFVLCLVYPVFPVCLGCLVLDCPFGLFWHLFDNSENQTLLTETLTSKRTRNSIENIKRVRSSLVTVRNYWLNCKIAMVNSFIYFWGVVYSMLSTYLLYVNFTLFII